MTQPHVVNRLRAIGAIIILAALTSFLLATEADALLIDPADQGIAAEESEPSQLPAPPEPPADDAGDVVERLAPAPREEPFFPPPATTVAPRAPHLDAADFGIGWPAAVAAGVAVVAVLIMALMWRRDESAWVRSSDRR